MKHVRLSTGDLADVVPAVGHDRLGHWIDDGYIVPVSGGSGKGDHRRFSPMQAVGLAVAVAVKDSARSCCSQYVATIVAAFARLDPAELEQLIDTKGPYFFQAFPDDRPILFGESYGSNPDVQAIARDVFQRIERVARREKSRPRTTGGRARGLAAAE